VATLHLQRGRARTSRRTGSERSQREVGEVTCHTTTKSPSLASLLAVTSAAICHRR
jgi:hypothetical protein